MKKILIIATTPLSNDGLTKIEMEIIANNPDVHFDIACGYTINNEYATQLENYNVIYYELPSKKLLFFRYLIEIRNLVKQHLYDTVYIHGNSALMFFEAFSARIGKAQRVITHCHNTKSNFPIIHYLVKPLFNRIIDIKIACSSYVAHWAYNGKKVKIILNGINIETFKFDYLCRNKIREELGWSDKFIIGHVGRFSTQKNHHKLIEIFEIIYQKNNSARLLLIGDGELKREIQDIVNCKGLDNVVTFLGSTKNVAGYYNAMDLMILPSLFEGLCLSAIEGQANGLPVVLSDRFSPETRATESAYTIPLNSNANTWAATILRDINLTRRNNTLKLKGSIYDQKIMMKNIRNILLGND